MFKVIKKDDELGAYIEDINLSNISKKTSIGLLSCLAENEVLFFRNQNISPRDHKRFASSGLLINRDLQAVIAHLPSLLSPKKFPSQHYNTIPCLNSTRLTPTDVLCNTSA